MYKDKVCEHCLIGMKVYSFYGPFRVCECAKDIHPKNWTAGFEEPCDGYPSCFTRTQNTFAQVKKGAPWYEYKFKYKLIPRNEMRKSESCLRQEEEEKKEREEKAKRLRAQAEDLLIKARSLEGK
ncbi:MAG: hypothetical protein AB1643_02360 [Patescibacteria group bacterium]